MLSRDRPGTLVLSRERPGTLVRQGTGQRLVLSRDGTSVVKGQARDSSVGKGQARNSSVV